MSEKPSIQQLENFVIYSKVRNFSIASHMANISQGAFSSQMKKLEEIVGVKLITRSNRGSDLTREGEFFLGKIQAIMSSIDEAIVELREYSKKTTILNIGILMSTGDVLMNRHVSFFQNFSDNIKINIYNLEAKDMLSKLEKGQIDIAMGFLLPQMSLEGYKKKFLFTEELVYYAPKLDLRKKTISTKQMAKYPMVIHSPDYFMTSALKQYFEKEGFLKLNIVAHLSTPYAIIHYCKNNPTGALLPIRMLAELDIKKDFYNLEIPLSFDTYLIYKNENPKIAGIEYFIDYLESVEENMNS